MPRYRGYRFPPEIISHAVWLYHRFSLSFRDVEDLLAERGITVTYETIRQWCLTFGIDYARRLRSRRGRQGDTWHLDELFIRIQGRQQYLWRAVDEDGDEIDILVQPRRNRRAAIRFFRKLLKTQGGAPRRLITDKLPSYGAACRTVMPSVAHRTDQYANNRAEVSHERTRQRERQMRGFKSVGHLQRFASVHGVVQNLFRVGRHLLRAVHHRVLRTRASPTPRVLPVGPERLASAKLTEPLRAAAILMARAPPTVAFYASCPRSISRRRPRSSARDPFGGCTLGRRRWKNRRAIIGKRASRTFFRYKRIIGDGLRPAVTTAERPRVQRLKSDDGAWQARLVRDQSLSGHRTGSAPVGVWPCNNAPRRRRKPSRPSSAPSRRFDPILSARILLAVRVDPLYSRPSSQNRNQNG